MGAYIEPDSIPISGRDEFDNAEKLRVIPGAESQVEWRLNAGDPIPKSELTPVHLKAMQAYASYMLAGGAYNPSEPRYGDVVNSDRGDDWADKFYQIYNDSINAILGTPGDGSDGGAGVGSGDATEDRRSSFQFGTF